LLNFQQRRENFIAAVAAQTMTRANGIVNLRRFHDRQFDIVTSGWFSFQFGWPAK